jgi:predicted ATP-dependent endonuclease of OLD family
VLAESVILVEGPTEELLLQRAYLDKFGKLPIMGGVDVITVNSLAFKRYCDIALLMKKTVSILTDNDGCIESNITVKYKGYIEKDELRFFNESDEQLSTLEKSVLNANLENGEPTAIFKEVILKTAL